MGELTLLFEGLPGSSFALNQRMSLFGFGPNCEVDIVLDDAGDKPRKLLSYPKDGVVQKVPLFVGNEDVCGMVHVKRSKGKKIDLDHNGIRIELIGQIEMFHDRGNTFQFVTLEKDLEPAGHLGDEQSWKFEFRQVEKQYEAFNGLNVRLRYFLRFTIFVRRSLTNVVKEKDFWVHNYQVEPETNNAIKMEVGIEECLHIEFEYSKSKYHLRDVVIGKIYFILVRIKIKHMEVAIIKRESTGSGTNLYNESETLIKFEIMDGAPVRGESIPVRLFLNSCIEHLTPTYRNIHTKFSVKYYLNLVLVDEEDRRYFKQQEIILYRRPGKKNKASMAGRYERAEDVAKEQERIAALDKAEEEIRRKHEADEAAAAPPPN